MKKILMLVTLTLLLPIPAFGLTGQEILKKSDKAINAFKDRTLEVELVFVESKKSKRSSMLTILQKGTEKRIIRFRSGIEKGRRLLTLGPNKMYVYLPNFRKVRRVAAHAKNQSFMGSDLTMEDIATATYADSYKAKKIGENPKEYVLELVPNDKNTDWKKMKVWVAKANWGFTKMEYYDKQGRHRKTWIRKKYGKVNDCVYAGWSQMTDHNRKHSTIMIVKSIKLDSGLSDRLFTKKGLIRGR